MNLGLLLFPNLTQLDLTGPLQVLHRMPGAKVHVVAADLAPVPSDCGLSLMPTHTFADAPPPDLICVPGGFGVERAIADGATMDWVRAASAKAQWVTSVCTGAFILGAAGLLRGRRATTHWAYHDLLPMVGAIPERARVVRDGNVITGGGVTAGIDFAFEVVRELHGAGWAERIRVAIEYDPAPQPDFGAARAAQAEVQAFYSTRKETFGAALRAAVAVKPN